MKKVLVASKTCGIGLGHEKLTALFRDNNMEPIFQSIAHSEGCLADLDGIIIGIEPATQELFQKTKKLKAIVKFGVGIDNIDVEAAARHIEFAFNTDEFKSFLKKNFYVSVGLTADKATEYVAKSESVNAWLLYDMKLTANSPEEFGIKRIGQ